MLSAIKDVTTRSSNLLLADFAGVAALAVILIVGLHLPHLT